MSVKVIIMKAAFQDSMGKYEVISQASGGSLALQKFETFSFSKLPQLPSP